MVDATDLKSVAPKGASRFKSGRGHHNCANFLFVLLVWGDEYSTTNRPKTALDERVPLFSTKGDAKQKLGQDCL